MSAVDSNNSNEGSKSSTEVERKKKKSQELFTIFTAFFSVLSLCTFVADTTTDAIVLTFYFYKGHWYWGIITLSVLVITSLVIHFFSIRWHHSDGQTDFKLCFLNFLQLGVIYRYISLLKLGFSLRLNTDPYVIQKYYQRHSDLCMLRLFECFLESAPQIILQMYIMFSTEDWNPWTGISVGVSLISLAVGIASYSKSIRNAIPHKERLSWVGLFYQMLWRAGTLTSRIVACVLCATALKSWFILVLFAHWLFMTIWVLFQKTDFCKHRWEEKIYNCVVGVIYCFCFFNLKEGCSRFRVTTFYTIIFIENICFTVLYYIENTKLSPALATACFLVVILSFIVGISSMMIYYCWFHPKGPIFVGSLKALSFDHASQKGIFLANGILSLRTLKFSCPDKNNRLPIQINISIKDSAEPPETETSMTVVECPSEMGVGLLANIDKTPVLRCWGLENHSYHSLDCLVLGNVFEDNFTHRTDVSSYRAINYGFRSQVVAGVMTVTKIHCSCLVLHRKYDEKCLKNYSNGKLTEVRCEKGSVCQSV